MCNLNSFAPFVKFLVSEDLLGLSNCEALSICVSTYGLEGVLNNLQSLAGQLLSEPVDEGSVVDALITLASLVVVLHESLDLDD